jgi:hypothetical protein
VNDDDQRRVEEAAERAEEAARRAEEAAREAREIAEGGPGEPETYGDDAEPHDQPDADEDPGFGEPETYDES